jgi:hypothetical protein
MGNHARITIPELTGDEWGGSHLILPGLCFPNLTNALDLLLFNRQGAVVDLFVVALHKLPANARPNENECRYADQPLHTTPASVHKLFRPQFRFEPCFGLFPDSFHGSGGSFRTLWRFGVMPQENGELRPPIKTHHTSPTVCGGSHYGNKRRST